MIAPCFQKAIRFSKRKGSAGLYRAFCINVLVVYSGARLYIVVESFISLRKVPIGVYYTPSWLQMIPHA